MKNDLKQLRKQYLDATDRMNVAIQNLRVDQMEFSTYDRMLSGEFELDDASIHPGSVFFRAYENLNRHLGELDAACTDSQVIHREIVKFLER